MGKAKQPGLVGESLNSQLLRALDQLDVIRSRLPPVLAVVEELNSLTRDYALPVLNEVVLQMTRDSFDMLVIDLASLREHLVSRTGVFNQLRLHLGLLRQVQPNQVKATVRMVGPSNSFGSAGSPESLASMIQHQQRRSAEFRNAALRRLFPDGDPSCDEDIDAFVKRFRSDTKAVVDDRNQVRAHRYETTESRAAPYYLAPGHVQQHVDAFTRYLKDLLLVSAAQSYAGTVRGLGQHRETATDLADIMVRGSINSACNTYGVSVVTTVDRMPWYYKKRAVYLARPVGESETGEA